MKLSISLTDADLARLDAYAHSCGLPSRSAAVQHAIRMLRQIDLEDDYAAAWAEWEASDDRATWEGAIGDGLLDAAR